MHKLPSSEYEFQLDVKGGAGKRYFGDFIFKIPTLGAKGKIEVMYRRLRGDLASISSDVDDYFYSTAYLQYTLIKYPDWWKDTLFGSELPQEDGNVLGELFKLCSQYEADYKRKVYSGKSEDVEDSEGKDESGER
jgi:hypothetical protein